MRQSSISFDSSLGRSSSFFLSVQICSPGTLCVHWYNTWVAERSRCLHSHWVYLRLLNTNDSQSWHRPETLLTPLLVPLFFAQGTGKAVMMMIHHSRNTAEKQWDETRVHVLQGTSRVYRMFFATLSALKGFNESWQLHLRYALICVDGWILFCILFWCGTTVCPKWPFFSEVSVGKRSNVLLWMKWWRKAVDGNACCSEQDRRTVVWLVFCSIIVCVHPAVLSEKAIGI